MGKSLKYVKEFDFDKQACEYSRGGEVKAPGFAGQNMHSDTSKLGISGNKNPKGSPLAPQKLAQGGVVYAKGGKVVEKATGERYPSRQAMVKHEKMETPRMQREELIERAQVKMPAARRKMVPVPPQAPLLAMKQGGAVPKAGAYKMGKVMGEFKAGELHSGSKTGPRVTNPKQAVAIAMSEARSATRKK